MYIHLPNKVGNAITHLDNAQKGLLFSALIANAEGIDTEHYEYDMTQEARMAFAFIKMWNDDQMEKNQVECSL